MATLLAACAGPEGEPPAPADAVGRCAVDPSAGALIGEILRSTTDPDTEQPAFEVRLETDPGEVVYVPTGVRVVDCDQARPEQRERNPEPLPATHADTADRDQREP